MLLPAPDAMQPLFSTQNPVGDRAQYMEKTHRFTKDMPEIVVTAPEKDAAQKMADDRKMGKMLAAVIQAAWEADV